MSKPRSTLPRWRSVLGPDEADTVAKLEAAIAKHEAELREARAAIMAPLKAERDRIVARATQRMIRAERLKPAGPRPPTEPDQAAA